MTDPMTQGSLFDQRPHAMMTGVAALTWAVGHLLWIPLSLRLTAANSHPAPLLRPGSVSVEGSGGPEHGEQLL